MKSVLRSRALLPTAIAKWRLIQSGSELAGSIAATAFIGFTGSRHLQVHAVSTNESCPASSKRHGHTTAASRYFDV